MSNNTFSNITSRNRCLFFGLLLASGLLLSGCNDRTSRPYRVGILCGFTPFAVAVESFKEKMTELGYIEDKNIIYDDQRTNSDLMAETKILEKFITQKVDLILALPSSVAINAKALTQGTGIPIIFLNAPIEGTNLVENVRRPGGNVTGVRFPGPDLVIKRLEILCELVPTLKRLYIPYDPQYPTSHQALIALRQWAASRGVTLLEVPVRTPEDLRNDLLTVQGAGKCNIDAIFILYEVLTQSPPIWTIITRFATDNYIPIAGAAVTSAADGAVFSYGTEAAGFGRQGAPLADKILKGVPPGNIPVVTPEAQLRINFRRARELGLTVPTGLLKMANQVIK